MKIGDVAYDREETVIFREVKNYVNQELEKVRLETKERLAEATNSIREELGQNFYIPGRNINYEQSPEAIAAQERNDEEYRYKEYLGILLQLHQVGHHVPNEINETLKKVHSLMF